MTDQRPQSEANETPEDVATLYSWANLHGAKYRDFSSSRAQAREEARLRVEEALAVERKRKAEEDERRAQEEAQLAARLAAEAAEAARQAEAERLAEIARQAEAERQAVLAAQEAQRQAAQQRVWQPPPPEAYGGYTSSYADAHSIRPETSAFDSQPDDLPSFARPSFVAHRQQQAPVMVAPNTPRDGHAVLDIEPSAYGIRSQVPSASAMHVSDFRAVAGKPHQPAWAEPGSSGSADYQIAHSDTQRVKEPGTGQEFDRPRGMSRAPAPVTSQRYNTPPTPLPSPYAPVPSSPTFAAVDQYHPTSWPLPEQHETRDLREPAPRPAWLAPEMPTSSQVAQATEKAVPPSSMQAQYFAGTLSSNKSNPPSSAPISQPPADDTFLDSRDRMAGRWYALKSVFDPDATPSEQRQVEQAPARVPVLAVFSLAGGVGKTSIVAALGRALSSRGERVLLVDTSTYGLLPFFFGARDQRPGQLRTFNPPVVSTESPIQLVTLDPEGPAPGERNAEAQQLDPHSGRQPEQDWLLQEVARYSRGSSRILVDLPTASGATTRRILRTAPVVLVPVVPDMSSVVSVSAIESFFRSSANYAGKPILPFYVLNQFDYSLPLHLDVREILREQIGDRLLPFALRRNPVVSEALAEGMTVMDYAPTASVAEDYASLAGWVRGLSAPAAVTQRGVRWSER